MEFPRRTTAAADDDDTREPMGMGRVYGNAPPSSPDYLRHRTGARGRR
jgi:hypothetical protein